jgi:hypothetical protein
MRQFSSVNYQFYNNKAIEGTNSTYNLRYSGDGGLNEYYWNNAVAIGKHLSAGITASYIAGSINQTETLVDEGGNVISSTRRDYYAKGRLQYGAIYTGKLSKKWVASVGAKYASKSALNYERTLTVLENSIAIIENDYIKYTRFSLPQSIGGGVALSNNTGTVTYAADYTYDNWSALNLKGTNWRLVNSSRVSGGAEFVSFKTDINRTVTKKSFQMGAFLNKSYLQVNNQQINEWGVTAGFTRTLGNSLMIGAFLEGGVRGTTQANLIKENYVQLSLNFSFRDIILGKMARYN